MLFKSFLSSSRKLVNVSLIFGYGNTKLIQNKCIGCKFLLEQSIHRGNCVTQFKLYSVNSSDNVKANVAEDDLYGESFFTSQHEVVTEENQDRIFNAIAKGDPEIVKKLKAIHFEVDVLRQQFARVPSKLTKAMFEELLELPEISNRTEYLRFLFTNEMRRMNLREAKRAKYERNVKKILKRKEEGKNLYHVGKSSMFLKIYYSTLYAQYAQRQLAAQMFSQHVVFDCSYDSYMSRQWAKDCALQFNLAYLENITHVCPLGVKVFNYDKTSNFCKYLHQTQDWFNEETHSWDFHSESFLDFYDKDRLVYLSPYSKHELIEWDHDAVYIIGAFVDKGTSVPASRVIYEQHNLRSARFPIDALIKWRVKERSLPLNMVLKILLELRIHGNWFDAFKNLHRRKVCNE